VRAAFLAWRDLAHPQAGGSEVLVDRLARGLRERGWDVVVVCASPVATRDYEVVANGGAYSQYVTAPLRMPRRPRPDVIVDVSNGIPFFSPLWQRSPVVCLTHHVHAGQWQRTFPRPVAALGWFLERRAVPLVYRRQHFVAVSPSTVDDLMRTGVKRAQISTITNGVDLEPSRHRGELAEQPRFVAVGRLVSHKGVDRVLDAWRVVEPLVGGELVIVGDGPERARLEADAPAGVRFVGRVGDVDKRALLRSAWALVHGAHHEGWGIVIMEAAAHGVPAIGFDVAGVRDAIIGEQTGLVATDIDVFAQQWIRIASDGGLRDRLGAAARERASDLGWSRTIDDFAAIAIDVATGRRVQRAAT
jgi:glycosyltransferase involved in cell wall biosynthesis